MKKTKLSNRRALLLLATALLLLTGCVEDKVHDFSVDGIHYNVISSSDKTCEVTYYSSESSSNSDGVTVIIPETVKNGNTTYTVTSIGDSAFYSCRGLKEITIPESVTSIGDEAFAWCTKLTSVTIPNSVTSIGDMAFQHCWGLTEITIPESVTSIGKEAFTYCSGLTQFNVAEDNEYYCSIDGLLFTKDKTTIIQFPEGSSMTSYDIPESVTSIGENAFHRCHRLTEITIPNSVKEIGDEAFRACWELKEITVPEGVTTIGDYVFFSCSELTEITIPNSVIKIGRLAFYGCKGLTSVIIPENVTSIGDAAFQYCTGLTSVTIPKSVKLMSYDAFRGCSKLTQFVVEDGNNNFCTEDGVLFTKDKTELIQFPAASSMTSYNIPIGVDTIFNNAFKGCKELTEVTIPNSVTEIGSFAFLGCSELTQFVVEDGNNNFCTEDGVLFTKDKTELIQFPAASSMTSYNIPIGVDSIFNNAFSGCTGLTSLTIPESVTKIGEKSFQGCTGLTSVTSLNPEPPTCSSSVISVFPMVNKSTCVLHVPAGSKEAYSKAEEWKDFEKIEEM